MIVKCPQCNRLIQIDAKANHSTVRDGLLQCGCGKYLDAALAVSL